MNYAKVGDHLQHSISQASTCWYLTTTIRLSLRNV